MFTFVCVCVRACVCVCKIVNFYMTENVLGGVKAHGVFVCGW